MPKCKNCGTRIEKLNKDICPVCGFVHPLEDVNSETIEITSEISLSSDLKFNQKSRFVAFMLFFLVGFSGAAYYYLSMVKKGLIWAAINVSLLAGLIVLFALPLNFGWTWGIIIPLIIDYLVNTAVGVYYLAKPDIKDGNGDFLK